MRSENSNRYKQILIDLDNYNALKELGKAGDSFNDVVRYLLLNTENITQNSSIELADNRLIELRPDGKSFILKIDSGLRKVGIDRIIGFKDHLEIEFLDEKSITVDYPANLQKIPEEVESVLLNSYLRLPSYAVKRISEYFHGYMYEIEKAAVHAWTKI